MKKHGAFRVAKYTLQQLKKTLVGKNVFFFRLLDPFPQVEFLSGTDTGYFAVNVAMAYRHYKFKEPAGPLTKFSPASPIAISSPSFRNVIPGGLALGSTGEAFWTADQVRQVASKFGYSRSAIRQAITFDAIKKYIDQQDVVVAALDVNPHGDPGHYGGTNAQWCVILGYVNFKDGKKGIIATHSWGGFYLWDAEKFIQSNLQLLQLPTQTTQMQLVSGGAHPIQPTPVNVPSLNEIRNRFVVIRV